MIQIIIMKKESMYKYLHLLHAPFENVGDRVIVHPTSSLPPLASVYHKALGAATSVFPLPADWSEHYSVPRTVSMVL